MKLINAGARRKHPKLTGAAWADPSARHDARQVRRGRPSAQKFFSCGSGIIGLGLES